MWTLQAIWLFLHLICSIFFIHFHQSCFYFSWPNKLVLLMDKVLETTDPIHHHGLTMAPKWGGILSLWPICILHIFGTLFSASTDLGYFRQILAFLLSLAKEEPE